MCKVKKKNLIQVLKIDFLLDLNPNPNLLEKAIKGEYIFTNTFYTFLVVGVVAGKFLLYSKLFDRPF